MSDRAIAHALDVSDKTVARRPGGLAWTNTSSSSSTCWRILFWNRTASIAPPGCSALTLTAVAPEVGRPYCRAVTSIDAVALIETPPADGGSISLRRWWSWRDDSRAVAAVAKGQRASVESPQAC